MTDVIWQNTVDGGTWNCRVERVGPYTGRLTVRRVSDGTEVLDKTVHLSYGATFGPDVDDVALWEDMCIKAIDSR